MKYRPFKQELRESNLVRYKGVVPPVSLIKSTIEKSNLSRRSFEITYGIVEKTLERYIFGKRGLPIYYWHIFYEFNNLEKFYANFRKKKKRPKKIKQARIVKIPEKNKTLIDELRAKLSR